MLLASFFTKLSALRVGRGALGAAPVRTTTTKHWNPKFKRERAAKVVYVKLPNFNEDEGEISRDRMRARMKERGVLPPRPWIERPFCISSTSGVFEPYVPPEGDGRASPVSAARARQTVQRLEKKSKSMMAVRKIRSFEEDWEAEKFARAAQDIYVRAHEMLVSGDRHALRLLVTEYAYPAMRYNTQDRTLRWRLVGELEPPRVVHARCTDIVTKENVFGQVTVRIFTQQQLAVYDRFGRLMHGSELLAKDVLEYVVFEKHLANVYGSWRLHDKIVPEWTPPREPSLRTRCSLDSEPVPTTESPAAADSAAAPVPAESTQIAAS
ncbi:Probable 39S ribosomal protein L45, mitochondrial [Eumeta japonica]|uniref:Large ribosomal subunit protein mL45 n=1 Tax=Eumeta variegata TaxID=151549 RepID=A0A4C1TDS8_EUMVA|nr:Probable 39S ribosomal protein L45, mitochondrial [Eumeta japonica]